MEKHVEVFKKIDKALDIISKLWIASIAIALAFGILALFVDVPFIGEVDYNFRLGSAEVTLAPSALPDGMNARLPLAVAVFASVIEQACGLVLIRLVREIIYPFVNGKPMGNTISKGMKKLSIFALCYGAVMEIVSFAEALITYNAYDVKSFFDSAKITDYAFEYESEGLFLIAAAVLFILSHVFVYVEELQAQVDETL